MVQRTPQGGGTPSIQSLLERGMVELALEQAQDAMEENPRDFAAILEVARVCIECRDFVEAQEHLDRALALSPGNPDIMAQMSLNLLSLGESERAMDLARHLQAVSPSHPFPRMQVAQVHLKNNRYDECIEALNAVDPDLRNPEEWGVVMGTALVAAKRHDEADVALRGVIDSTRTTPTGKAYAWFQICKSLEKLKDYDGAWAAATAAHDVLPRRISAEKHRADVDALKEVMNRKALAGWARATHNYEKAVFVVGMPRSGTSLLEQILSMHPDVANAGELSVSSLMQRRLSTMTDSFLPWPHCIADMQERDADQLQAMYAKAIGALGEGKKRVTDKSLLLVYQMGFLAVTLPGARSIMLHRNALDNIVSCYTTQLACLGHSYTNDLTTLAKVWKIRRELQDFWMENLETAPMELHYEQLVSNQESETRRLLEYLGLPWEQRCLEFHTSDRIASTISFDQVNQKMYTSSVERWKRYEKHLGPALEVLGL